MVGDGEGGMKWGEGEVQSKGGGWSNRFQHLKPGSESKKQCSGGAGKKDKSKQTNKRKNSVPFAYKELYLSAGETVNKVRLTSSLNRIILWETGLWVLFGKLIFMLLKTV